MNKSSAQRNIESLTLIAHRLGELCDEITYSLFDSCVNVESSESRLNNT